MSNNGDKGKLSVFCLFVLLILILILTGCESERVKDLKSYINTSKQSDSYSYTFSLYDDLYGESKSEKHKTEHLDYAEKLISKVDDNVKLGEIAFCLFESFKKTNDDLFKKKSSLANNKWKDNTHINKYESSVEEYLLDEVKKNESKGTLSDYILISTYKSLYEFTKKEKYKDKYNFYKFRSDAGTVCREVIHTHSANVLSKAILNTFFLDTQTSEQIAKLGIKGYGECLCSLHGYFNVEDDYSIGFCIDQTYYECKESFCGRTKNRKQLAKKLGGYRYSVPRGSGMSGTSGGNPSNYLEALEYGRQKVEDIVQQQLNSY